MSEETEITKRVLEMLTELSKSVRALVENQERLAAEQSKAGKAIGEAGALLITHGAAIGQLLQHCGLLADDSGAPPSSSTPVN